MNENNEQQHSVTATHSWGVITKVEGGFNGEPSKHPDDAAVDRFAAAMKAKMAKQRAKGYGGWDDPAACPTERLQQMLVDHIAKGDPVDVANFAMMLWNRSERTEQPAQQQEPKQSEIFCGVDFADGLLSVSVFRRRDDDVAELLHAEQIELPAQQHDYRIKYDRPCYKCRSNFCPGSCKEPEHLKKPAQQQEPVAWAQRTQELLEVFDVDHPEVSGCGGVQPPASKPWVGLVHEETHEAIGTAGVDLLELAKLWSDNKIHVYQFDNEARKIIEVVLRRASAKLREKNA